MSRHTLTAALLALAALGAGVVLSAAARQPADPFNPFRTPAPQQTPAVSDVNTVFMPPGKYTAIVMTTNARDRRWIVALKTNSGTFPITLGPMQTVTIPFEDGWKVVADMNARIESRLVPFEDLSQRNLLDGNENLGISAWGITESGPVNFAPPAPAPTKRR